MNYPELLAKAAQLDSSGLLELRLNCYHCNETAIASLPFGHGFPNMSIACCHCTKIIKSLNELKFEIVVLRDGEEIQLSESAIAVNHAL